LCESPELNRKNLGEKSMSVSDVPAEAAPKTGLASLPRNVWAVTAASFLTDISSEMVSNLLPLFLYTVLGARTDVIGLIEGVAETTASILKIFSGWFSDRLGQRKSLAVAGYALSTLSKPFLLLAGPLHSWGVVLGTRFGDRVGKGVRTAPRDALVADSVNEKQRGLAFGLHRAGDTAGAVVGLLFAIGLIWYFQRNDQLLEAPVFQTVVWLSLIPAVLAVVALVLLAKEVAPRTRREAPKFTLGLFDRRFKFFLVVMIVFTLGNSSDAFLILRAQAAGLPVLGVLGMMLTFNVVYTLVATPAGSLSDKIGRRRLIVGGWVFYGLVYLGFALVTQGWQAWVLMAIYGIYYGMTEGAAKAFVADLVPSQHRGTAYGIFNAAIGLTAFPASLMAGVLWGGVGAWKGFGPSAPFFFGAVMALTATVLLFMLPGAAPQGQAAPK
jgi:MFS family permease